MKSIIITLIIACMIGSCAMARNLSLSPDVIQNHKLNTTDIPANGNSWTMSLPPNFKIIEHKHDATDEVMMAQSRFYIGSRHLIVMIASRIWGDLPVEELYVDAHDDLAGKSEWKQAFGPGPMKIGNKQGYLDIGIIKDVLMMQFSFIAEGNGYVMRCSGDSDSTSRVVNNCEDLLGRFQPKKNDSQ